MSLITFAVFVILFILGNCHAVSKTDKTEELGVLGYDSQPIDRTIYNLNMLQRRKRDPDFPPYSGVMYGKFNTDRSYGMPWGWEQFVTHYMTKNPNGFDQNSNLKRSTSLTKLGLEAFEKILSGTKKLRSKQRYRRYLKVGDMDKALKDFLSVNPTDLTEFTMFQSTGVKVLAGNVGDKKIYLINYPRNPTIEIVDINAKKRLSLKDGAEGGQYGDRVVYVERMKRLK